MASRKPPLEGPPSLAIVRRVATVRFERPREHNRIDPDDIPMLRAHVERAALDASVRALVFTGAGGRTFSSGFTIEAILGRLDRSFEELLDTFPLIEQTGPSRRIRSNLNNGLKTLPIHLER